MKADLYVQGRFWAAIDVPQHSLLALLGQGMITRATEKALELQQDLQHIQGVQCSISLRFTQPIPDSPGQGD